MPSSEKRKQCSSTQNSHSNQSSSNNISGSSSTANTVQNSTTDVSPPEPDQRKSTDSMTVYDDSGSSAYDSNEVSGQLEDVYKEPAVSGTPQETYNDKYNFHHPIANKGDAENGLYASFSLAPKNETRHSNSEYGYRYNNTDWHNGIDLTASNGTEVYAITSGTITYHEDNDRGKCVILVFDNQEIYGGTDKNLAYARYQHLSQTELEQIYGKNKDGNLVGKSLYVDKGDKIGATGDSGAGGFHFHFNLYIPNDSNQHIGYNGVAHGSFTADEYAVGANSNLGRNESGSVDPRRYIDFSIYKTHY